MSGGPYLGRVALLRRAPQSVAAAACSDSGVSPPPREPGVESRGCGGGAEESHGGHLRPTGHISECAYGLLD